MPPLAVIHCYRAFLIQNKMETVIITGFTAKSEGVILETNIPARLKPNRIPSKETFVSWDKLGNLLFENYTESTGVVSRDSIRNNSSLKEEVEKQYCMPDEVNTKEEHEKYLKDIGYTTCKVRLLKDDKWQVIDDSENVAYQGSLSDCESWIKLNERGLL